MTQIDPVPSAVNEQSPEEAARFAARVRRLMLIAGLTTSLSVAAVLFAIGYKLFRGEGSAPVQAEYTAMLRTLDAKLLVNAEAWFAEKKLDRTAWDKAVAKRLRDNVFGVGNTIDPAIAYRQFRGRDPGIAALMRKRGFPVPPAAAPAAAGAK